MTILLFSLVIVSILGLAGFFRVQQSLRVFSDGEIPLIIQGARLSDATNQLMVEVERLIASGSEATRRIAYSNVQDKFRDLEELIGTDELARAGQDDEFRVLKGSVSELGALVASRIGIEQKNEDAHAVLLKYPEAVFGLIAEIETGAAGEASPAYVHRWISEISGILSLCGDAAALTNPSRIARSEEAVRRALASLQTVSLQFPPEARSRVSRFEAGLETALFGPAGMLTVLKERSAILREETAKSNFVRRLADDFRTASANLLNEFVTEAAEDSRSISRMVSRTLLIFIVVILVATAAFIAVMLYFRRRLVQRLVNLNNAILRQVAGGAVSISTEGNDEITDMAYSFLFYVDAVNVREKALLELATRDSLTGISNRRHFLETARQELVREERYGRPASMLMLDIDFFKVTNDTWGHPAGDLVLKSVVTACRESIRDIDVFGRIGGEEFAFLLLETALPGALEIAERIRSHVEETVCLIDGNPVSCTVSIGVSVTAACGYACETLLKAADDALYTAKSDTRNCVRGG